MDGLREVLVKLGIRAADNVSIEMAIRKLMVTIKDNYGKPDQIYIGTGAWDKIVDAIDEDGTDDKA